MGKGSLEVVCGSMFSGKTEELMRRLKRAEYAHQKVLTLKHQIDDRGEYACILSHDGNKLEAKPLDGTADGVWQMVELATDDVSVVGVDEAQFFPDEIVDAVMELVNRGKRVICAGLDLDFRGEPFGVMPRFMALADHVTKLRAICMQCGAEANNSQRLIDGRPARYSDPTILVGAAESYEARCRACYAPPVRGDTSAVGVDAVDAACAVLA